MRDSFCFSQVNPKLTSKVRNKMSGSSEVKKSEKEKEKSTDLYHLKLTFFISLLAWPFCFILDNGFVQVDQNSRAFVMMVGGSLLLAAIVVSVAKLSKINDWLYYGFSLFAFTCTIDLIITLEFIGLISGFMSEYLKFGEPYLHCPYGSAIALFDGIGFYPMYLLMVYQLTNGKSWRSMGLYWAGGILNSMIVLLLGVATGQHSPTFCTFFNVPYVIVPAVVAYRALSAESRPVWTEKVKRGLSLKLFDLVLGLGFLISMYICFVKGLASLGSTSRFVYNIIKYEPALFISDPAPYASIQVLLYLLYLIPIQGLSLFSLFKEDKKSYLWEIACVHTGAILQAQFSFIYLALDPQTPIEFQSQLDSSTFWFVNLIILIVPHLYLYRLSLHRQKGNVKSKRQ